MGRHRWRCSAVVVVVVTVLISAASGIAAVTGANAIPARVVGRWARNVAQQDYARQGVGDSNFETGVWAMVIKKSGDVDMYRPGGNSPDFFTSFTVSGDRLGIHAIPGLCLDVGHYRWKVAGRLLTITKISDKYCKGRIALYSGVWKRK